MSILKQKIKVLIVGGGLSGLHTAYELNKRGIDYLLVEARHRLGGRILSKSPEAQLYSQPNSVFDLGPSWFWPHQLRIQSLLNELKLNDAVFEQTELGSSLYEDKNGTIHADISGASMRGSYRIKGGIDRIITRISHQIPANTILTHSQVKEITYLNEALVTRVITNNEVHEISSDFVILALPPRLAARSIKFRPPLCASRSQQLKDIGTWMAGQAKVAVLYDKPLWHDQGFSGDVISLLGPLQEIHDASTPQCKPYGLIGFVGAPPDDRQNKHRELRTAIVKQLSRLFGESAASPIEIYIKDWAFDPYTSTREDQQQIQFHTSGGLETCVESGWDSRLVFSGTETAGMGERNNGYLEGALEASERTISTIMSRQGL